MTLAWLGRMGFGREPGQRRRPLKEVPEGGGPHGKWVAKKAKLLEARGIKDCGGSLFDGESRRKDKDFVQEEPTLPGLGPAPFAPVEKQPASKGMLTGPFKVEPDARVVTRVERAQMLTAQELAEKLGVSQRSLARYVARGCPHKRGSRARNGRLWFDFGKVSEWLAEKLGKPPAMHERGEPLLVCCVCAEHYRENGVRLHHCTACSPHGVEDGFPSQEILGRALLALREELGMGQRDAAEILGVAKATVYRWERGRGGAIPSDALERLSESGWEPSAKSLGRGPRLCNSCERKFTPRRGTGQTSRLLCYECKPPGTRAERRALPTRKRAVEFAALKKLVGVTGPEIARRLGVSNGQVGHWVHARSHVPDSAFDLLNAMRLERVRQLTNDHNKEDGMTDDEREALALAESDRDAAEDRFMRLEADVEEERERAAGEIESRGEELEALRKELDEAKQAKVALLKRKTEQIRELADEVEALRRSLKEANALTDKANAKLAMTQGQHGHEQLKARQARSRGKDPGANFCANCGAGFGGIKA